MIEYSKFLPWLMVFGFPAMAFWMTKNVLVDYAKKSDLKETCQKLSNRINMLEVDFKNHKQQSDKENVLLFSKLDDLTKQIVDMNKNIVELLSDFKHMEEEIKKK